MTTRSRGTLIVSASLLIAVVAAFVAWSWSSPSPQAPASARASTGSTSTPSASTAPTRSADTPASTVPSAAPAAPAAPATAKGPSNVPASEPARVDVVTTFAGWNTTSRAVEVGGYAAVVEPVGTCTLRLIQADKVVTRKNIASADATTVACGGFSVPGSELNAGQWQAVLAYASSTSAGEAVAVTVKVP
jgi:hypothetical protein